MGFLWKGLRENCPALDRQALWSSCGLMISGFVTVVAFTGFAITIFRNSFSGTTANNDLIFT